MAERSFQDGVACRFTALGAARCGAEHTVERPRVRARGCGEFVCVLRAIFEQVGDAELGHDSKGAREREAENHLHQLGRRRY